MKQQPLIKKRKLKRERAATRAKILAWTLSIILLTLIVQKLTIYMNTERLSPHSEEEMSAFAKAMKQKVEEKTDIKKTILKQEVKRKIKIYFNEDVDTDNEEDLQVAIKAIRGVEYDKNGKKRSRTQRRAFVDNLRKRHNRRK